MSVLYAIEDEKSRAEIIEAIENVKGNGNVLAF